MTQNELLTILTALIIAITCAIQGVFLVLRNLSMVGDAISHSVLPGIVLAYLLSGFGSSYLILILAAFFGLLCTVLIELFKKKTGIREDASTGIVFTTLFAFGILLIALFAGSGADIDQECALFGELGSVFFFKIRYQDWILGTKSFWNMVPIFLLVLFFVWKGFKGLKLMSFDEDYAKTGGFKLNRWHYGQMFILSLTTVMSFESVGAIMVIGMLVVPTLTARQISQELKKVIFWSVFFAISSVLIGFLVSKSLNLTLSGTIVSCSGIQFGLILLTNESILKKNKKKLVDPNKSITFVE